MHELEQRKCSLSLRAKRSHAGRLSKRDVAHGIYVHKLSWKELWHGGKPKQALRTCHGLAAPFVVLFMVTTLEEETEMCVFQARVQRGFIALMGKSLFKVASVSAQTTL